MHACMQASVSPAVPVDVTVDRLARDLGLLVKHLLVSTNRDFFSAMERAGLSLTQMKCLQILSEAPEPLAVGSLSEELGLSVPAVSRAVEGLVQRGEVKRAEDPRDRRSKLLTVSTKGAGPSSAWARSGFAGVKHFVAGLSEEERRALGAGLD